MVFWNKKHNQEINSKEFELLHRRMVTLDGDLLLLSNKYDLLMGNYKKINLKISRHMKEEEEEESTEKDLKGSPVAI